MSDAASRPKASASDAGGRGAGRGEAKEEALSDEAYRRIGDELKAFYDGLVNEPLPDRFVELLRQLEEREKSGEGRPAGGSSGGEGK